MRFWGIGGKEKISIEIDKDLYTEFCVKCAQTNVNEVIEKLIKDYLGNSNTNNYDLDNLDSINHKNTVKTGYKPKKELIRVVRSAEGEISLDLTGKASGRGAYICNNLECLKKARKSKRIDRTFEITIPDGIYDKMEEEISK